MDAELHEHDNVFLLQTASLALLHWMCKYNHDSIRLYSCGIVCGSTRVQPCAPGNLYPGFWFVYMRPFSILSLASQLWCAFLCKDDVPHVFRNTESAFGSGEKTEHLLVVCRCPSNGPYSTRAEIHRRSCSSIMIGYVFTKLDYFRYTFYECGGFVRMWGRRVTCRCSDCHPRSPRNRSMLLSTPHIPSTRLQPSVPLGRNNPRRAPTPCAHAPADLNACIVHTVVTKGITHQHTPTFTQRCLHLT